MFIEPALCPVCHCIARTFSANSELFSFSQQGFALDLVDALLFAVPIYQLLGYGVPYLSLISNRTLLLTKFPVPRLHPCFAWGNSCDFAISGFSISGPSLASFDGCAINPFFIACFHGHSHPVSLSTVLRCCFDSRCGCMNATLFLGFGFGPNKGFVTIWSTTSCLFTIDNGYTRHPVRENRGVIILEKAVRAFLSQEKKNGGKNDVS